MERLWEELDVLKAHRRGCTPPRVDAPGRGWGLLAPALLKLVKRTA
jgi:hypothetical protein